MSWFLSVVKELINGILDFNVINESNITVFNGLLSTFINEVLITTGKITFFIKASRAYAEGPRTFKSSFLFIAVIVCSIIFGYWLKMSALADTL